MSFYAQIFLSIFALSLTSSVMGDVRCKLLEVEIQYDRNVPPSQAHKHHQVRCMQLEESGEESGEIFGMDDLPPGFSVANNPFVDVVGAVLDRGTAKLQQPPGSYISSRNRPGGGDRRAGLRRAVTGPKSVLVVRVIAADASTTDSMNSLSDSVFGTFGDSVNLKSQFQACSDNQLSFNPASSVPNGVVEVQIPNTVSGESDGVIVNAVTSALQASYGSPSAQWDYVMYCLPPGTADSWIAYAYVNSWLSVYNDKWCTYVSAQMHELGHNIGLAHSNEGTTTYADQTGMMGYSYSQDDSPLMCFNNAKNWQLGWFMLTCQKEVLDPTAGQALILIGAAQYSTATGCSDNEAVVFMLDGSTFGVPGSFFFIGYNAKVGANSGTVEGGNTVTVQRTAAVNTYAESDLVAKLGEGQDTVQNGLVIKFCSLQSGKASVAVGLTADPCLLTLCGNGVLDAGEACEDGNLLNNDGCSATCQVEFCGDGVKQANEECDDGNAISGDGCTPGCVLEFCGDGIVNNNGETCDDGNALNNDGCSSTCRLEFCGDGVQQASEECDDGNTVSNDGCTASCVVEFCGDGIINNGEECDGAAGTPPLCSDGCSGTPQCTGCQWDRVCADGVCDATEASLACPIAPSSTCSDCINGQPSSCGDGICDISLDANGRAKEDSFNCHVDNGGDCEGKTNGTPRNRFYCGNDASGNFVGCGAGCTACGEVVEACCGDGECVEGVETAVSCAADCAAALCTTDADCAGSANTPFCGASGVCVACEQDSQCDDGLLCTGQETCVAGECVAGGSPCASGETCSEGAGAAVCEPTAPPQPCTVTPDFPNCCCDDALSTLNGKPSRRTCVDGGISYSFGERCPSAGGAAAGAALLEGVEKQAGTQEATRTEDTPLVMVLLLVLCGALVAVVAVLLVVVARQRRCPGGAEEMEGPGVGAEGCEVKTGEGDLVVVTGAGYEKACRDIEAGGGVLQELNAAAAPGSVVPVPAA